MSKDLSISTFEFELIEAWLEGNLTDEQAQAFQEFEKNNPYWNLKVQEVQSLQENLESYLIRSELDEIHQENISKHSSRLRPIPAWMWAVAASLALVLVSWWGFQELFQESHERLFQTYYEADPGLITAMSGTDSYEFERGMVDYKEGKYQEALGFWEPLLDQNPEKDTLLYFLGIANLELGQYALSEDFLIKVASADQSEFQDDALWYLGLIYLKTGEIEKAKQQLTSTTRPEAQSILEKLE
jgi:tetratricopeptide (TPR) repeat protein